MIIAGRYNQRTSVTTLSRLPILSRVSTCSQQTAIRLSLYIVLPVSSLSRLQPVAFVGLLLVPFLVADLATDLIMQRGDDLGPHLSSASSYYLKFAYFN